MKTDNELIAEFMCVEKCTDPNCANDRCYLYKEFKDTSSGNYRKIEEMKYHTSWDWLMPVVEKIEMVKGVHFVISELGCDVYSFGKQISNSREETKILTVYKAVVEFIKW